MIKSDFQKQIDKMDRDMEKWKNTIISIVGNNAKLRPSSYRYFWVTIKDEIKPEQIKQLTKKKIKIVTYIIDGRKFIYHVKYDYPKELEESE